uniref:Calsyntenin-1-like n=1 Tax=Saccoglossus kowalevskii TaxID=10224 RepID=A0ABM0MDM0_SACKO|nr:PREDICTED: calsyntenin-1-like [Saccoglossus kowalevskii]
MLFSLRRIYGFAVVLIFLRIGSVLSENEQNKHKPWFDEEFYHGELNENERLVQLHPSLVAFDSDDGAAGQICNYVIKDDGIPFTIEVDKNTGEGFLRATEPADCEKQRDYTFDVQAEDCGETPRLSHKNTEPLSYDMATNYILAVTAYDCGGKKSPSVLVTILVSKICTPGWQGIPKRIEYEPGSGRASAAGSIELLPTPGLGHAWTEDLSSDEGYESDQIYEFDGEMSAVLVPDNIVPANLTDHFTISTWMKHGPNYGEGKETILCSSDKSGLNRHHYSLYIHNCRLVFLLRRDFGNLETFRPAEFRWKLDKVCDKEWHHYVLNVDFPKVTLYVDGDSFEPHHVTEDWPLHKSNFATQLTVGAAWEGADGEFVHHLKGYLAGLTMRPGSTESEHVITCLNGCKESLEFHDFDLLELGEEATFDSTQSELTLKGQLIGDNFQRLMQHISYVNSRQFPTPGKRAITLKTKAICDGVEIPISNIDAYVMVLQPPEPTITVTCSEHHAHKESDFLEGIKLFGDVHIVSTIEDEEDEDEEMATEAVNIAHNLDSCSMQVNPPLNTKTERITLPDEELKKLHLDKYNSTQGVVIRGVDSIANYEDILRKVVYINTDPSQYYERSFKLSCSELNGRYTSNLVEVQVNILHSSFPGPKVNNDKASEHVVSFKHNNIGKQEINKEPGLQNKESASKTGTAMTFVIVSCVGFLVFMIVLGIFRIRAAHRRAQVGDDRQEMAWDDSSLTITVNPMQQTLEYDDQEFQAVGDSDSSDDDDDDDDSSCHDDLDSSEDEGEPSKEHQLEWDDSTLTY